MTMTHKDGKKRPMATRLEVKQSGSGTNIVGSGTKVNNKGSYSVSTKSTQARAMVENAARKIKKK